MERTRPSNPIVPQKKVHPLRSGLVPSGIRQVESRSGYSDGTRFPFSGRMAIRILKARGEWNSRVGIGVFTFGNVALLYVAPWRSSHGRKVPIKKKAVLLSTTKIGGAR